MESDEMFEFYLSEVEKEFSGWNFSYILNRWVEFPKQWSYHSLILPYVKKSTSMLDMGTGGGEFLSKLPFPKLTYATEGYKPNISIAASRLEPLGVKVVGLDDLNTLPFEDEKFDLIINRHEFYVASEIYRTLLPKGRFITQQVGNENCIELNQLLGAPNPEDYDPSWTVDFLADELHEQGFTIEEKKSEAYPTRVYDIGAIVYFLKAIPWQIPEFNVNQYKDKLYEIHQTIQINGFIEFTTIRYLIISQK